MALELAVSVGALAFKAYSFAQSLEADAAEVSVQYELIARRLERLMHLLGPLKAIYETGDDSVQVACLHMREDLMACLLHAAQLQSLIDTKSVLKKASASNVDAGALLQRLSTTVSDLTLLLSVSVLRQVGEPKVDPKAASGVAAPEPVHAVGSPGPEPPAAGPIVPAKARKFEDPYDKPVLMLAAAVLKRMDQNLYSEKGALAAQGASNPFPSLGAFVKSVKDLSAEMRFVKRSSGNFMYLEPVIPGEPFCLGTESGFVDTNFRVSAKAIQQAAVYRFEAAEYRSGEALFYLVTETADGKRYVGYESDSLPGLNKLFRKMAVPFMETVKDRDFAFLFKLPLKISAAVTLPFAKRKDELKAADGSTGAAPGSDVAAGLVGSGMTTTTRVYFTLQRLDQGGLTLSVTRADKDDGEFHALATLFNQSSVAVFVQRFELYLPPSAPPPPASQVGEGLKELLHAQTSSLTLVKKAFEAFKDPITSAANDFIHTVDL